MLGRRSGRPASIHSNDETTGTSYAAGDHLRRAIDINRTRCCELTRTSLHRMVGTEILCAAPRTTALHRSLDLNALRTFLHLNELSAMT